MFLARVTGSVVATHKTASMRGQKLLIVDPVRIHPENHRELVPTGRSFVVVDVVGAGIGQIVIIVQGSSARYTPETEKLPVDAAIIGIVDRVQAFNHVVYSLTDLG